MRILITGASGVIGRRAIPLLVSHGHEVTATRRSAGRVAELDRVGVRTTTLDLFDRDAVRSAVAGHDAVINLATSIPGGMRMMLPGAWRETGRIRREASAILADEAARAGVGRFVQESFAPVYPDGGDRWITEDQPIRPARYNRAVADAEASVRRFTDAGGAGVVLRFALLYGPGDPFTRQLISSVRRGYLPLFGNPDAFVSFVTHDDAASAVVAAVTATTAPAGRTLGIDAGAYNVVDDQPLRRRELGELLGAMLGVRAPKLLPTWMSHLAGSLGETMARSLRISNTRLTQSTTWSPRFPSMREGIPAALSAEPHGRG